MSEEVAEILKNYLAVCKVALSWRQDKITAGVAMEQISYILIDVPDIKE